MSSVRLKMSIVCSTWLSANSALGPIGVTAVPIPSAARKPVGAKKVDATTDDLATTAAVVGLGSVRRLFTSDHRLRRVIRRTD